MLSWRLMGALVGSILINLNMTTCRSPGETEAGPAAQSAPADVQLEGVDTSQLTGRERREWSSLVSELLAPCPDQPVNIAQCVKESRSCAACAPAARFLVQEVQKGRTRAQAEASYRARFGKDQVKAIELSDSPRKGSPTAPVIIVEWADFECPACRAASSALDEVVKKRPEKVQLVFKNYPLDMYPNAETAARAAMAAHKQGKFWKMHDALFAAPPPLSRAAIDGIAKQLELDMDAFAKDIESEGVADRVAQDRKQGEEVRVRATPTIYVNGREFSYSEDLAAEMNEWIELELQLLGKTAANSSTGDKSAAEATPPQPEGTTAAKDEAKKDSGAAANAKSSAQAKEPAEGKPAEGKTAESPAKTEPPAQAPSPVKDGALQ